MESGLQPVFYITRSVKNLQIQIRQIRYQILDHCYAPNDTLILQRATTRI